MSDAALLLKAVLFAWFFFSFLLLIHEYGHLIVCQRENIKVSKVQVGAIPFLRFKMGGVVHEFGLLPVIGAVHCDLKATSIEQHARIAAAGPVASVLLGVLLLGTGMLMPAEGRIDFVALAGEASLYLAALNLIPLPPMDGYPILALALKRRGVVISARAQKRLLAAGLAAVVVTTLAVV